MNKEENNKRGKYKISTRPISYTKELFLVLCLVGRELSPKTVKLLSRIMGNTMFEEMSSIILCIGV